MIDIKKLNTDFKVVDGAVVKVTEMGNITEVMYSEKKSDKCYIQKLNDDYYIDLRTGEIKECNHIKNRAGNMASVSKSLKKLRALINTNVEDVTKCKWITLTYAKNMTDTKKLYDDFKKFNMKMRYYLKQKYEYIAVAEPQGRGAWHLHVLMIFKDKAPFIHNDNEMANIWGNGFTTTKKVDNLDNVGAYLTAYLTDLPIEDALKLYPNAVINNPKLYKILKTVVNPENGQEKRYIKALRMLLYPPKFNIYRCSRGIKKPNSYYTTENEAMKKVSAATLTFQKTLELSDTESDYNNLLNYRYYNKLRKTNQ